MSMWSAATFHRRERHHDARIVSRTWSGSTGSAVRNRSLDLASPSPGRNFRVLDSRLPPERSGGGGAAEAMGASLLPGTALAGRASPRDGVEGCVVFSR